jgi:hypothetical protein
MAEDRKKLPTFTTPKAATKWVTLNKPSTNFKAEGEYQVVIILPEASDEAQALVSKLTEAHTAAVAAAKQELAKDPKKKAELKNMKVADLPFSKDLDKDTGDETGNLKFNFKAKASGVRKADKSEWHFRPPVYDAKGKPMSDAVKIFAGSVVKVAYQLNPFYTTKVGAGISLKLQAVQVIELRSGAGRDAAAYGFGQEDGFDSSDSEDGDTTDQPAASAPASGATSGADF